MSRRSHGLTKLQVQETYFKARLTQKYALLNLICAKCKLFKRINWVCKYEGGRFKALSIKYRVGQKKNSLKSHETFKGWASRSDSTVNKWANCEDAYCSVQRALRLCCPDRASISIHFSHNFSPPFFRGSHSKHTLFNQWHTS